MIKATMELEIQCNFCGVAKDESHTLETLEKIYEINLTVAQFIGNSFVKHTGVICGQCLKEATEEKLETKVKTAEA